MIYNIDSYTVFINKNIKCIYYPRTQHTVLSDQVTGEYIVLNLEEWSEVVEFLKAISKR